MAHLSVMVCPSARPHHPLPSTGWVLPWVVTVRGIVPQITYCSTLVSRPRTVSPELFLFLVIGSAYRGVEVRKFMGTKGKTQQKIVNILPVWS